MRYTINDNYKELRKSHYTHKCLIIDMIPLNLNIMVP